MAVREVTGLVPERVEALLERVRKEVDAGHLPACQVALAKDGELAVFQTFGEATDATRFPIFSATKAFVASAFWLLLGDGSVSVDERVADILPGFGTNGKDVVTVEQVLLHTAGFPFAMLGPPAWDTHEGRLEAYSGWRLNWEPGTRYEYHATSAHWVLADIIAERTGIDHRAFVRQRIFEPLGLRDIRLGVGADEPDLADLRYVGQEMTPDELEAAFGIREIPAPPGSLASMQDPLLTLNTPEARAVGLPGGGALSTAADIARFYQALLRNEPQLWDAEVLADGTQRVRNRLPDPMLGVEANRALGTVVAGDDGKSHLRGFGRTASPRAFGHGGAGGQIAWGDPETGISFGYVTNGLDRHMLREARRTVALCSLAALCATPL